MSSPSHNQTDPQLIQQWNDRLMQHDPRLNLNKTKFFKTNTNETGTFTVSSSGLPRTKRFKYPGLILSGKDERLYKIVFCDRCDQRTS